jgi:iron complex outermembrane receptor protein
MTIRRTLLASTVLAVVTVPAAAQEIKLEEIVVTARKREESLMQVPLAITAFTSKDIESAGLKNLTEVSQFTPGLFSVSQVGGGSGRNDRSSKTVVVRGFSISPALIFLDGAPVGNPPISGSATPEVDDVARVEVLKGPQSAYFGRSTFSGAINFITKDPSFDRFKGRVRAEYASFNSTDDSISLEGPLVEDKVAARLNAHYMNKGGQYTNAADTAVKLGQQSTASVSAQVMLKPSDALRIKGFFTYMRDDDGPPAQIALKPPADMNCNLGGTRNGGLWYCGEIPTIDKIPASYISAQWTIDSRARSVLIDNVSNFPTAYDPHYLQHGGLRRDAIHTNLNMDYTFAGGWTANSITAYHQEKVAEISNLSFRDGQGVKNNFGAAIPGTRPYILWLVMVQGKNHDFSQELRLSSPSDRKLRVLVGANYLRNVNPGGAGVYGETPIGNLVLSSTTYQSSSTPALFGGVYYDVLPKLTVSGEVRYQWDKIHQQALTTSTGALIPGGGPLFEQTFGSFSPRVTADYKYAENSTAYALWSRGYRPGGFNVQLAVQPPSVLAQFAVFGVGIPYKQERLDNFEVGLKSSWLDGRAQTRLALYKELWRQGQVPVNIIFTLPTGGVNQIQAVANVGAVNLQGAEAEAEFQVTKNLLVSGTFSLADSNIRVFTCGDCVTIRGVDNGVGNKLPQAPKYQWSLSAEYTDHLAGAYDWYARVDYSHRGSLFIEYANVAKIGAKENVNLRIGVRRDNLQIEGFVKNLTQDTTAIAATLGPEALFTFASGQEIRTGLPDKRTFGIRANYSF